MKPLIVGLTGFAGSGKDTSAHILQQELAKAEVWAELIAFADPIRWALAAMGVPPQYIRKRELKEAPIPGWGVSYRHLAQTLGTEWGRTFNGEGFWVQRLQDRLDRRLSLPPIVMITDVRMPNEADWIQAQGGLLVRVDRKGVEPVRTHTSERADLLKPDYLLVNDAGLDELHDQCKRFATVLINRVKQRASA